MQYRTIMKEDGTLEKIPIDAGSNLINGAQQPIITPSELSRLESMSNAQLIDMVKRMACQCGLVALMSEDEREQALFDVLATKGIKAMDVPAIKEYFDRKKGKPIQGIDQRLLGHMTISWED